MTTVDALAREAARHVRDGMIVGLGTGRAAERAIRAIGERVRSEGLHLAGVPTSAASAELARSLGIGLLAHDDGRTIDLLLDGVDELAPDLAMLKGRGGAMTLEKIIARASRRRVYLMQQEKLVSRLGERYPVPVEILEPTHELVRRLLEERLVPGSWRVGSDGARARTDLGNPILDCPMPDGIDPASLARLLDDTPGVIGHGLFLDEADLLMIEDAGGALEVRERSGSGPG